jgi:hypothetical protein
MTLNRRQVAALVDAYRNPRDRRLLREYGFGLGSLAGVDCLGRRWWVNGGVVRAPRGVEYVCLGQTTWSYPRGPEQRLAR